MVPSPIPALVLAALALLSACASSEKVDEGAGLRLTAPTYFDLGDQIVVNARSGAGGLRVVIKDARDTVFYDSKNDPKAGGTRIRLYFTPPLKAYEPFRITATDASGAKRVKSLVRR